MTPVLIETTASLQEIAAELEKRRYTATPGKAGWGSVKDGTDDVIGDLVSRGRRGGKPEPVLRSETYPDQLRARLYWDEADRALVRAFGSSAGREETNRLRAADVTFAEYDEGQLFGLLGERNDSALRNHVIPEVVDVIQELDPSGAVKLDNNPLEFGDDDFFRWVLYRSTHRYELSDDLSLPTIRSISTQDRAYRLSNLSRGVELDRPELLALVGQRSHRFGPAKFVVYSNELQLAVSLEVTRDGQFSVYRGQTEYESHDDAPQGDEVGLQLVQDVAFHVLPELKRLHNSDDAWVSTDRQAFVEEARTALRDSLS